MYIQVINESHMHNVEKGTSELYMMSIGLVTIKFF